MSPPERALMLSCDEKSQIQALGRTQPGLPIKKGRAGTMTYDYKRNGTTTLSSAVQRFIQECRTFHKDRWVAATRGHRAAMAACIPPAAIAAAAHSTTRSRARSLAAAGQRAAGSFVIAP